jgi:hypothetical protein
MLTTGEINEVKRSAQAFHLRNLAAMPRPLHPAAPAGDQIADEMWDAESVRLSSEADRLAPVLPVSDMTESEKRLFRSLLNAV